MSEDKWRDLGRNAEPGFDEAEALASALSLGFFEPDPEAGEHVVENIETGEIRTVQVYDGQTVGEAIANGQWVD